MDIEPSVAAFVSVRRDHVSHDWREPETYPCDSWELVCRVVFRKYRRFMALQATVFLRGIVAKANCGRRRFRMHHPRCMRAVGIFTSRFILGVPLSGDSNHTRCKKNAALDEASQCRANSTETTGSLVSTPPKILTEWI